MPDTARTCDHCGGSFEPSRKNQRFCPGGRCRVEYHAARYETLRETMSDEELRRAVVHILRLRHGPPPTPQDEKRRFRVRY